MTEIENKLESILLFKNEPVAIAEFAKILKVPSEDVQFAVSNLQKEYENRGIVIVTDGELVSFGTHPDTSGLIEEMQKEELSRELGRAGLETLAIVLYKGPISRREIDYIRGVNSTYTLRTLATRGLIERTDPSTAPGAGRSYSYKPTLKLLRHLGITRLGELPEYERILSQVEQFNSEEVQEQDADER